jgi:hypothetical protein
MRHVTSLGNSLGLRDGPLSLTEQVKSTVIGWEQCRGVCLGQMLLSNEFQNIDVDLLLPA